MEKRKLANIDLALDADLDEQRVDKIETVNDMPDTAYADELAFAEDILTVVLHKGRERFAPDFVPVGCNDERMRWYPVNTEVKMKRKYVEILARSSQMDVRTRSFKIEEDEAANTVNEVVRSLSSLYPLTVVHDPSPKGRAWFEIVMRSGG